MYNTPLISVVIAFLNPGTWLNEAIESVIVQTYEKWEIILVDDGSIVGDSNNAIMYCKKYPDKIFYIEHEGHKNKGLTISRNVGISKAKGELIAFLDADDYWLPHKLSAQIDLFKTMPQIQVICEASWFWSSWENKTIKDEIIYIGAAKGIYEPPALMGQLYPLGNGQPPCPSGIIITKDALYRCGGFEERFSGIYQLYEDQAFLSKVYSQELIYISDQANNFYRKRSDSMSSAANDKDIYKKVRLFYSEWLKYKFPEKISNSYINKLVEDFSKQFQSS